jgi:hypothetical protein
VAREAGALLPTIQARLYSAVDTFDAVWFGGRRAAAADVAAAREVATMVGSARIEATSIDSGYAVPR